VSGKLFSTPKVDWEVVLIDTAFLEFFKGGKGYWEV
jgi:hypothetical protein